MILQLNNTKYGNIKKMVFDIREAVKVLNTYVDKTGLCSSEMDYGFGVVTDERKILCEISYNGKIVEMSERERDNDLIISIKGEFIK